MSFHLGKPILVMLVTAAIAGGVIATRPKSQGRADLVMWTFADSHAQCYRGTGEPTTRPTLVQLYEQYYGKSVSVQLLSYAPENIRLQSMFMSGMRGPIVPDVVEVEIGSIGRYFRPPVDRVGLRPLDDLLKKDGWDKRIIKSRFAPWSKQGVTFGIPHDVHPTTITYREDLFREAGIDLSAARTWPAFQEACLKFQNYWRSRGRPDRHAMELPLLSADYIIVMLLQRHMNLIDDYDRIYMTDPRMAQIVAFYAQLVAGPRNIAAQSSGGEAAASRDINEGNICAFITPDWRVRYLKDYTQVDPATGRKVLDGKMRMMPLPVFEEGDARTATWGGTMIGIPRACPPERVADAWKVIELFYLSRDGLRARQAMTNIVPPVIEFWNDPDYQRPDPYFGGQQVDKLYVELAREIPQRYVTPATSIAASLVTNVLYNAEKHVESHGTAGLDEACRKWLKDAADDVEMRIKHGRFDQ